MPNMADLEVGIHRSGPGAFSVSLRKSMPENEIDQTDIRTVPEDVVIDVEGLRRLAERVALGSGADEYGDALGRALFGAESVRTLLDQAVAANERLRLRLFIGPSAVDLHDLLWETLPDPTAPPELHDATLATSERIVFSRYLSSQEWMRVQLRRKSDMRALVVIANPTDLHRYARGSSGPPLAPVDVEGELRRATAGLRKCGIDVDSLASGGNATLGKIAAKLREGFDILYIVSHGQRIDGQPKLWLETDTGEAEVITGRDLADKLWKLDKQPRLVVLLSCMSAGGDGDEHAEDGGALSSLGPLIASMGIPAVLAMQGNISMKTAEPFMESFFARLSESGRVDQAVAAARAEVAKRPDAWMPVLFMRLRTGRIWYEPGMVARPDRVARPDQAEFEWKDLVTDICEQRCTVFLGPGLLEGLVGSWRTIAHRWAEDGRFPLPAYEMDDLPHVAQYVHTKKGEESLRADLRRWFKEEILRRYGAALPPELNYGTLRDVMDAAGRKLRQDDPFEPHRVLARLPFPIYISTNPDNLLTAALKENGRPPVRDVFHWRGDLRGQHENGRDRGDAGETPAWDAPVVYHMFGNLEEAHRKSMVLTEDQYFDYLIGATENKELIPLAVREAMTDRALLFIGFQMPDRLFRVLLRIIVSQEGGQLLAGYRHVAVQVDPEDDRIEDVELARRYLERYFRKAGIGEMPTIYWGSSTDFLRELHEAWIAKYRALPDYPINLAVLNGCGCNPIATE